MRKIKKIECDLVGGGYCTCFSITNVPVIQKLDMNNIDDCYRSCCGDNEATRRFMAKDMLRVVAYGCGPTFLDTSNDKHNCTYGHATKFNDVVYSTQKLKNRLTQFLK